MINQKKIPALNNANLFFLRRLAPIRGTEVNTNARSEAKLESDLTRHCYARAK
jgi:hypothetical protein